MHRLIFALMLLMLATPAGAAVRPAVEGVLAGFASRPLVGLPQVAGQAELGELYAAIVSDPRFAAQVRHVVVDFGSASNQAMLDRYLAGEDVPPAELRAIWTDVVGGASPYTHLMYPAFFERVRRVNQSLPVDRRIRVWLGQPPVDWARYRTREDVYPAERRRVSFMAELIDREILSRGQKALVIAAPAQLRPPFPNERPRQMQHLRGFVEVKHPSAFYVVTAYFGHEDPKCTLAFEDQMAWTDGVIAAPVRGGPLERALRRLGCKFAAPELKGLTRAVRTWQQEYASGVSSDALLYLGQAAALTTSPVDPALIEDAAYLAEQARRFEITAPPARRGRWTLAVGRPFAIPAVPLPDVW